MAESSYTNKGQFAIPQLERWRARRGWARGSSAFSQARGVSCAAAPGSLGQRDRRGARRQPLSPLCQLSRTWRSMITSSLPKELSGSPKWFIIFLLCATCRAADARSVLAAPAPSPGSSLPSQSPPLSPAHRAVAKLPHFKNLEMNGNQLVERAVEDVRSLLEERNMVLGGGGGCFGVGTSIIFYF